jgi:hypothetical protein
MMTADDIVNGDVKAADIGQQAVGTDEIGTGEVKVADIGHGYVKRSTDRSCERGTELRGALAVAGKRAALRLNFADADLQCLSRETILWKTSNMKRGSIKIR